MANFLSTQGFPMVTEYSTPQEIAIALVYQYAWDHLDKSDNVDFKIEQVYIVWMCFTLGNWKMLLSTELTDGMYYEVTYDRINGCAYLDAYKKFENKRIAIPSRPA